MCCPKGFLCVPCLAGWPSLLADIASSPSTMGLGPILKYLRGYLCTGDWDGNKSRITVFHYLNYLLRL